MSLIFRAYIQIIIVAPQSSSGHNDIQSKIIPLISTELNRVSKNFMTNHKIWCLVAGYFSKCKIQPLFSRHRITIVHIYINVENQIIDKNESYESKNKTITNCYKYDFIHNWAAILLESRIPEGHSC